METFWNGFALIVFFWGILDAIKYKFITQKICKYKSSRETSRKFLNVSIANRLFLLIWAYFKLNDWVVTWSCIIALYFQFETLYYAYIHYPYKRRGLKNFKRPPFTKWLWNSIVPNKYAKKL